MTERLKPLVLNVEDDEVGRYTTTRLLRQAGFEIVEAGDGLDAVEKARKLRPDLMVVDVKMPGIDGFEVCRRIKADAATSSIPVVHVSASFTKDTDRVRGLEGGADAYLTEPLEPEVLTATINALLRIRRAEQALSAAARDWQATFDAITDGVAVVDSTGAVIRCNNALAHLLGRPASDIIGRKTFDLLPAPPDRRDDVPFNRMVESLRREKTERQIQGRRWLQIAADPIFRHDGTVAGAVWIVSDITGRKRIDEQKARLLELERDARAAAEATNRTKDEFLATLSHELRTPLNAMLGWLWRLRRGNVEPGTVDRALETIERNTKLQAQLIEDLLDMSRIITGKLRLEMRSVNLGRVIENAVDTVRMAAEAKRIRLVVDVDAQVTPVSGDPGRLQQILWNLVSNAIKFTPAGGTVTIRLREAEGAVHLEVSDTGIGIPHDFLPFVFDRFRQADSSAARTHGGLGIGLAIVRHLVESHGGSIVADSGGPGTGATFSVTLPVSATDVEALPPGGHVAVVTPTDGQRSQTLEGVNVLAVDDDPDAREIVRVILGQHGATVLTAGNVAEAMEAVERLPVDVVVSDIGLPGEDGYIFIEKLRALQGIRGTRIPAAALTAYTSAEERRRALIAGYQLHIPKPVDPEELVAVVASLAGRIRTD
jgi:PAS domain S-box-containing protein